MNTPASSVPLAAFRARSFRFQWPADLLTSWAFEMETLILGWYVLVRTDSVLLLTVFGSLQQLGTLAAPTFGVIGDRLGGRAVLCAIRTGYVLLASAVLLLAATGRLAPVHALAISAIAGILRPNDLVMRNTLIGDTVPRAHFTGALSLSRATQDSARIAGALAGAGLFAALGIGAAYAVVVAFYAAGLALTFGVSRGRPLLASGAESDHPLASVPVGGVSRTSHWREAKDGLLYVWTTPRLLAAMWLAFLVNLTAYPVSGGLLPYLARNVYGAGEQGLGSLVASFSAGALIGSVAMVVSGGSRRPERFMVVNALAWYALLLALGFTRTIGAGAFLLGVAGLVQSFSMISLAATLLNSTQQRFRGRVMGVRTLAVYGLPLGLMASGALIARVGYTPTVALYATAGLAFTALIALRWRASL